MRVMLVYDPAGNIVDKATVWSLPEDVPHPFGDLTEDQRVLTVEDPGKELSEASLAEIRERYRVDVKAERLVRKRAR